ncbi:MAG: AAA family ATPase [Candidatus Thermoplasmatota archaeon]
MTTITISGTPGSGKSTVARKLRNKLDLEYVYSGMIFRDMAKKHDMTLSEFGDYCEKNPEIDKELDKKQLNILKKDNIIVEGRLAGWLTYQNEISAFKIMLDADIDTRAKRIVKREGGNVKQRKKEMINREKSEAKRYKNYYSIDITDKSIYDLVIDTSDKPPDEIVEIILQNLDE